MEVRGYEVGDELQIPAQDNDWHREIMSGLAVVGTMFTVEHQGQPIIVMGMMKLWPGVADSWSLVHPDSGVPARALVRVVREHLEAWGQMEKLWRVNATAADERQMKWMKLLGFEHEFTQRRGGRDGVDLHGMVKWIRGLH